MTNINCLSVPLSMRQIILFTSTDNPYVSGDVCLDVVDDIVGRDFDEFLDVLSTALVGSDLLMDVSYKLVGATSDGLAIFHVKGDATDIIAFSDELFAELKTALWENGVDALSNFIGKELSGEEDNDTIENMLDEVGYQMPDEELIEFFRQYVAD